MMIEKKEDGNGGTHLSAHLKRIKPEYIGPFVSLLVAFFSIAGFFIAIGINKATRDSEIETLKQNCIIINQSIGKLEEGRRDNRTKIDTLIIRTSVLSVQMGQLIDNQSKQYNLLMAHIIPKN